MKKHNLWSKLVNIIESLHDKGTSGVMHNNITFDWFQTTVGMRQCCILSPCLFDFLLEQIDALEGFIGINHIWGATNLSFADDVNLIAGSKDEPI